ncbi:acyltransferase [Grimontia hollisae]|uniref:1-acyl-sn-glycerol-3-phosphate acyltransferase n=2 Tax=Grimontia hollisae TaxID=673 RepID=D0I2V7_GRIHO|nr:acyltransferase [Grimontia hollisae]AMG30632.1 acyltransferase [Grimontia hollisae]EEY74157.1 1-acyl-sn-glycerol-3-phosphate acyltransferase [Grimontia hollisae CIP 101886]STO47750.1 Probable acyltransferase yihG [Grimontia hollisae]STO58550.1 Probable acyltransferase yihG [Grimontia hollisae]
MLLFLNAFLVSLNTAFWSVLICCLALIKILFPIPSLQRAVSWLCNGMIWAWATGNLQLLNLTSDVEWDIEGGETLSKEGWYLLICNHLSWADIVVIFSVFRNRIPMAKFFLKQQLLYVPFLGMACWAVDMPFMKRYSRQYLLKHPEKRGCDLATTRKSCERFLHTPTTVVNFVEGTRFTDEKRRQTRSPYQNLLPPKTGGIAYTLGAMGDQFDAIINVTVAYPDNRYLPFRDLLDGKMKRIVVRIDTLPVDDNVAGDYFNDKAFKRRFHQWLNGIWQEKDKTLESIYTGQPVVTPVVAQEESTV